MGEKIYYEGWQASDAAPGTHRLSGPDGARGALEAFRRLDERRRAAVRHTTRAG